MVDVGFSRPHPSLCATRSTPQDTPQPCSTAGNREPRERREKEEFNMDSFRVFGVFRGDDQLSPISDQLFRATLIRGWCFGWCFWCFLGNG